MSEAESRKSGAVFGRYILVECVGQTTTGELWLAIDPDLDRKVALEFLRQTHLDHRHARERLLAAARAMARVRHPNVVVIHDVGEIEDQLFLAMEHTAGRTLDKWLAEGPHPWQEVVALMIQAGAGLAAAHDIGLVHRDVQPANIVIGRDGRVRVLAFGLARPEGLPHPSTVTNDEEPLILESQDESGRILRARPSSDPGRGRPPPSVIGAPAYMSPEQHRGDTVDARSDLFSFCAIMFEALYGTPPFTGMHALAIAAHVISGDVVEIPVDERAPAWIHKLVMRGLATEPDARFDDMDALLAALARSPEHARRRRRRIFTSLIITSAVVAGVIALAPRQRDPCDDQLALAPAWDPSLQVRVEERGPPGSRAGLRLSEGFERQALAWSEASAQLCRDERARRVTPGMSARRERCLAEHRAALVALVSLADEGVASGALEALAARPYAALRTLGDPSACNELGPDATETEPLDDDQLRAQTTIRLLLDLEAVGVDGIVLPQVELLDGRDDPSIVLLRGRVALARGELDRAETLLHEVAQLGMGRDPALATRAWISLVDLALARAETEEAGAARDPALAEVSHLLDYAEALGTRDDPVVASELALRRGRLGVALDDPVSTVPFLDAAIERAELDPGQNPDLLASMLEIRSQLHRSTVKVAADKARARAVLQAALGPT